MLELFRACPRCKTHLDAKAGHCPSCGQIVGPEPVSRTRRALKGLVLAALGVTVLGVVLGPSLAPFLRLLPQAKAVAKAPKWSFPIAEPAARAWAFPLEKSLEEACGGLWARFSDRKYFEPTLNFQLLGGTLEAAKQTYTHAKATHTAIPRLLPEETDDALASIGSLPAFVGRCLSQSYARIAPCEAHRDSLGTPAAAACFTEPVQQLITGFSLRTCAELARLDRVKNLCSIAAERAEAQVAQAAQAAQPAAQAAQPAAKTGM